VKCLTQKSTDLGDAFVHIRPIRLVDDLPGIWVLGVVCNIIIHEHNNVLVLQASTLQDLVCMAYISLPTKQTTKF
jgi:hypothetical protein